MLSDAVLLEIVRTRPNLVPLLTVWSLAFEGLVSSGSRGDFMDRLLMSIEVVPGGKPFDTS